PVSATHVQNTLCSRALDYLNGAFKLPLVLRVVVDRSYGTIEGVIADQDWSELSKAARFATVKMDHACAGTTVLQQGFARKFNPVLGPSTHDIIDINGLLRPEH